MKLFAVALAAIGSIVHAAVPGSIEQDSISVSQTLRPVTDEQWQNIAGTQINETYAVVQGDTLWGISGRLFGDSFYWPKVWALNNGSITNPHLIVPGKQVVFFPGSGSSLPAVAVDAIEAKTDPQMLATAKAQQEQAYAQSEAAKRVPFRSDRSQEWRKLPRQRWEQVSIQLPPEVDPQGFDKSSKISFKQSTGIEIPALAATATIPTLGEIAHADRVSTFNMSGSIVYIEANEDMQTDYIYSISSPPTDIGGELFSARSGYSYHNKGKVRITESKDGYFIGRIIDATDPIKRGDKIIPLIPRYRIPRPKPGPSDVEGKLVIDRGLQATFETSQHSFVFVDRGTEDGVSPGMVFRNYLYDDPNTGSSITSEEITPQGDFIVIQTSEEYSLIIGLNAVTTIKEGSRLVLLTDVSGLSGYGDDYDPLIEATGEDDEGDLVDDLDRLDTGSGLTEDEEKELRQLEDFDEEKDELVDEESEDDEFSEEELDGEESSEEDEFGENDEFAEEGEEEEGAEDEEFSEEEEFEDGEEGEASESESEAEDEVEEQLFGDEESEDLEDSDSFFDEEGGDDGLSIAEPSDDLGDVEDIVEGGDEISDEELFDDL